MPDEIALEIIKRNDALVSERKGIFDSDWQTLSQYFIPQLSDINTQKQEGASGWFDQIYDSTGIEGVQTCAAGMRNWMTPSNEPWCAFEPPEEIRERDDDEAPQWCAKATDTVLKELARSNFYVNVLEDNQALASFGTGMIFLEEGRRSLLNFRNFKVGTYAIAENEEGYVDTLYRESELTARQAAQKFGEENLPASVTTALAANKVDQKFWFVHCVRPREEIERAPGRRDGANMPVASITVAKKERTVILNSGYDETPHFCARFGRWGKTPWGFGPAYLTLPNARQLNYITQYMDSLAELKANPRVLEPEGLSGQIDYRAGGRTTFDPTIPNGKPEAFLEAGDFDIGLESIKMKQEAIKRAFFADIFLMLQGLDQRMTAYEVAQRMGEKLEQFSPAFDRLTTERLTPLMQRVFGICFRAGKLGRPPSSMLVPTDQRGGVALALPHVEFTGRLAMALRAQQSNGFLKSMQFTMEFVKQTGRADVLDNIMLDQGVRKFLRDNGVDADLIRPMKGVIEIRRERVKQAQEERALMMAQGAAKAGKDLGKAPPEMQQQAMSQMGAGAAAA